MGEEFLIQRKYAPRELKRKHIRIAKAIMPLLKKCGPEEFQKAKEMADGLFEKNRLDRRSLFSTLQSLGFEPADARNTPLFDAVPGLIPVRTIAEAWKAVEENLGLVNMVIRYGARRGNPAGPGWEEKRGIVIRQMFDNALYWDDAKGSFSTYVFSCAGSSRNEIDKMIGPYVIPRNEAGLMGRIAEERAKTPGISNAELAELLGTDPERIRALDIGRASRSTAGMDHDNIFYSGGEDDDGQRRRRVSHSEIDSAHSPPSPEARLEKEETRWRVGALLASLPSSDQKLLRGVFGIGAPRQDFAELAREQGCTPATLQVRFERLLRHIRIQRKEELSELLD